MTGSYKAPEIGSDQVTPMLVRDELLKCFESANKEFMGLMHQPTTVFQGCGVSFDSPTKTGIVTAIGQCKTNAEGMMGPAGAEIIRHHYNEMMKLVDKLPEYR
jgi:hypothetical protein